VSSHYPLLHPPTNSFWYRIGTEANSHISPSTRNPALIFSEQQGYPAQYFNALIWAQSRQASSSVRVY